MDEGALHDRDVLAILGRPKELVHLIFGGELDHETNGTEQAQKLLLSQVGHFKVVAVVVVFVVE